MSEEDARGGRAAQGDGQHERGAAARVPSLPVHLMMSEAGDGEREDCGGKTDMEILVPLLKIEY